MRKVLWRCQTSSLVPLQSVFRPGYRLNEKQCGFTLSPLSAHDDLCDSGSGTHQ